jgi:hypothetical protein
VAPRSRSQLGAGRDDCPLLAMRRRPPLRSGGAVDRDWIIHSSSRASRRRKASRPTGKSATTASISSDTVATSSPWRSRIDHGRCLPVGRRQEPAVMWSCPAGAARHVEAPWAGSSRLSWGLHHCDRGTAVAIDYASRVRAAPSLDDSSAAHLAFAPSARAVCWRATATTCRRRPV